MKWIAAFGVGLFAFAATTGIDETFSGGLNDWWTEGGERAWVEDGRLFQKADPAGGTAGVTSTVWNRSPQPANFDLTLDAHVMSSSTDVNNVNLFFSYQDPSGKPLETSKADRPTADYEAYHALNGYIITFLHDPKGEGKARIRIRRDPGFHLLAETFAYECKQGKTYSLHVLKRDGVIIFSVDGKELLRATDPNPLPGGYFGLRTFRTLLWWDNIRLQPLS